MLVSAIVWSLVIAISFELCRLTRSYDYKSFFTQLLGPFWFLFEVLLVLLLLLVLSVVGAASGELIHNLLNVPLIVGTAALLITIGVLVFYGSKVVELFISSWSVLIYLCFISLVVFCFVYFPDEIKQTFLHEENTQGPGWLLDGGLAEGEMVFRSTCVLRRHGPSGAEGVVEQRRGVESTTARGAKTTSAHSRSLAVARRGHRPVLGVGGAAALVAD